MKYGQILPRLRTQSATRDEFHHAMERMHRFGLVDSTDPDSELSADQLATLIYLSAGTNETTRDAACYNLSQGEATAWSDTAHADIVSFLAFMIQDTWRPFGMVDHITFFRNSGAAIVVNETDRALMHRFDGLLPINATGQDSSNLTGLDLMLTAASFCGDLVHFGSTEPLTTVENESLN